MERILVLVHSPALERATMQFACYLSDLTGSKLTGVLVNDPEQTETSEITVPGAPVVGQVVMPLKVRVEHAADARADAKRQFSSYCKNQGSRWVPDIIDVYTKDQLLIETRFADLLIVSADASLSGEIESVPTEFVQEVLRKAECPVVVAPLMFEGINEIVFAYDGSTSAVYAIKQFTHLLPQLQDLKVTFLEVNEDSTSNIEYKENITDYLKMHYSAIGYKVLVGVPESELFSYFLGKKNVIIVMGAFGKKVLPSFLQHSTANLLLKTTSLPVFIAHT